MSDEGMTSYSAQQAGAPVTVRGGGEGVMSPGGGSPVQAQSPSSPPRGQSPGNRSRVSPMRPPRHDKGPTLMRSQSSFSDKESSAAMAMADSSSLTVLSSQTLADMGRMLSEDEQRGIRRGPPSVDDRLLSIAEDSRLPDVELVLSPDRMSRTSGPPALSYKPLQPVKHIDTTVQPVATPAGSRTSTPAATPSKLTVSSPSFAPGVTSPKAGEATQAAPKSVAPTLWEYLAGEAQPGSTTAVADPIWGATERDVMYNSLIFVPYQLERIMWFGLAVCMDPFLAVFTTVPLRALKGLSDLLRGVFARMDSIVEGPLVRGDQLFDMIYMGMFSISAWVVCSLNAGVIYFWMKDLSQEFIKLSVIFTAMEICDKILTSFGTSALYSLSCTCTQYCSKQGCGALQVVSDSIMATALSTTHAVALMCEGIAFSVAMNSRRTTLLALVISFNFAEVKGTVFKKFDPNKLTPIVYQDIVERFHMVVLMLFVVIEDMDTSESWGSFNGPLMIQVGAILASELAADTIKHAVVGKFNLIRPGVYREYMRDLCEATAKAHANALYRVVQMEPVGTAAIFYRMILSFVMHKHRELQGSSFAEQIPAWGAVFLAYVAICVLKLSWGYAIRRIAAGYLVYYEERFGKARAGSSMAQAHKQAAATASKKDN